MYVRKGGGIKDISVDLQLLKKNFVHWLLYLE